MVERPARLFRRLLLEGLIGHRICSLSRYAKSEETNFKVTDPQAAVKALARKYASQAGVTATSHLDGVRVEFEPWWFNVRPSNTEPYLRLNMEAHTQALLDAQLAELQAAIASLEGQREESDAGGL